MIRKLILWGGGRALTKALRGVAEGQYGPGPQVAYVWLKGKKTWSGVVLTVITAVLAWAGFDLSAFAFGTFATVVMGAGLLDKGWNATLPAELTEARWYRWVHEHSATLAAGFATATAALATCDPTTVVILQRLPGHPSCEQGLLFCGLVTVVATALGLGSAVLKAPPPGQARPHWFIPRLAVPGACGHVLGHEVKDEIPRPIFCGRARGDAIHAARTAAELKG